MVSVSSLKAAGSDGSYQQTCPLSGSATEPELGPVVKAELLSASALIIYCLL